MLLATAALLLLLLIAAGVTVADAVRSAHWRVVAVERRRSWLDQVGDEAPELVEAESRQAPAWVRASAQ